MRLEKYKRMPFKGNPIHMCEHPNAVFLVFYYTFLFFQMQNSMHQNLEYSHQS